MFLFVHDNGAVGNALGDGFALGVAPIAQHLMFGSGRDAQILVRQEAVDAHAQDPARGHAKNDNNGIGRWITQKILLKARLLINLLMSYSQRESIV
jgi:hypothetical protein